MAWRQAVIDPKGSTYYAKHTNLIGQKVPGLPKLLLNGIALLKYFVATASCKLAFISTVEQ